MVDFKTEYWERVPFSVIFYQNHFVFVHKFYYDNIISEIQTSFPVPGDFALKTNMHDD